MITRMLHVVEDVSVDPATEKEVVTYTASMQTYDEAGNRASEVELDGKLFTSPFKAADKVEKEAAKEAAKEEKKAEATK